MMDNKAKKGTITFLEALEEKYAPVDFSSLENIQLSSQVCAIVNQEKKQDHRYRTVLTLDGAGINSAGDHGEIHNTCPNVKELDLSHNGIDSWQQVLSILVQLPCLSFLNLSHNPLHSPFESDQHDIDLAKLPPLRRLALSKTNISVGAVESLLSILPSVDELHLSLNDFSAIPEPKKEFPTVENLFCCNSNIREWGNVSKLGKLFPNLKSLVISQNSFETIEDIDEQEFRVLSSLSLCETKLNDWKTIERLNTFPSLKALRITQIPLLEDLEEAKRRPFIIARLPSIVKLNGSPVEEEERENAERAFIRHYMDESDMPERYHELVATYGKLEKLVEVDLAPRESAYIGVMYEDSSVIPMKINLQLTTSELKEKIAERFKLPPKKPLRLFYVDQGAVDVIGKEEMRIPNCKLYRYDITDGDEIHAHAITNYRFKPRHIVH